MYGQSAIVLTRKSSANSVLRRLKVYVDGQFVLSLRDGETSEIQTSPGEHEVTVRMDWTSSQSFGVSLARDEKVALTCAPTYDYFSSIFRGFSSPGSFWSIAGA